MTERMSAELLAERPDGSVVLTLKVGRPEWLVGWLLQYGAHAEVLSPPSLRKHMRAACQQVLRHYRAK
jgi:proteasome accessory factor B